MTCDFHPARPASHLLEALTIGRDVKLCCECFRLVMENCGRVTAEFLRAAARGEERMNLEGRVREHYKMVREEAEPCEIKVR
jgi:hypothetical protein